MDEGNYTTMLEEHDIKPTANRLIVLSTLDGAGRPMSLTELEYKIMTIDKSGIFRALSLFREHHLVHVIEDGGDGVRYELCHSHHDGIDDDLHVHFHCEQCHETYCLEHIAVPDVELPEGFLMSSVNYIIKGICPRCAHKRYFA